MEDPEPPLLAEEGDTSAIATVTTRDLPALVSSALQYSTLVDKMHAPLSHSLMTLRRLQYANSESNPTQFTLSSFDITTTSALDSDEGPLIDRISEITLTAKVRIGGTSTSTSTGLRKRGGASPQSPSPPAPADDFYDATLREILPYPPSKLSAIKEDWTKVCKLLPALVACVDDSQIIAATALVTPAE